MISYEYKLKKFFENDLKDISNPRILEFGVKEGRSTKILLDYCKKNNGELFSVDIEDYSNLFSENVKPGGITEYKISLIKQNDSELYQVKMIFI